MQKEAFFPRAIVFQTDQFLVAQDCEIPIPGFFILSSKRGIQSMSEFTPSEEKEFAALLVRVRRGMRDVLGIQEVYFFQNEDSEHGFHVWLFPRHDWMEPFGRKIESVKPIMHHARGHLKNEVTFYEVEEAIQKMKVYFNN